MQRAPMLRRIVTGLAVLGGIAAIATEAGADASRSNPDSAFQLALEDLVTRARPGILGISVIDLDTGNQWGVNDKDAFPMMSVFKVPVVAAVLDMVDRNELALSDTVTIGRGDLRKGASEIAKSFAGTEMTFTVDQLMAAAVSRSDNTAVDALIKRIGGPAVVDAFLKDKGIGGMRIDLDEGGIEHVFSGLGANAKPPPGETGDASDARLWRGYQAFLADPRNRSTPQAAAAFLQKLWNGDLLSDASTQRLLDLMYAQTKPMRLRSGLPDGARLADKCGTSVSMRGVTAAFNDIGIMTLADGRSVIIAAFLTAGTGSREERTTLFADLARQVASRRR